MTLISSIERQGSRVGASAQALLFEPIVSRLRGSFPFVVTP
jgi:hypothetical protein